MKKKIIAFLLTACFIILLAPTALRLPAEAVSISDATKHLKEEVNSTSLSETAYLISDWEDLAALQTLSKKLATSVSQPYTFTGKYFYLTNDIVCNTPDSFTYRDGLISGIAAAEYNEWEPIKEFTGTLDGQGHTISGLYMREINGSGYYGFIGLLNGYQYAGKISNLSFDNCYYYAGLGFLGGSANGALGAIAGSVINNGGIQNCSVINCYLYGGSGGIAGGVAGETSNCFIRNCVFDGKVLGRTVGAICGAISGGGGIENCLAKGEVIGTAAGKDSITLIGGICGTILGNANANIYNCGSKAALSCILSSTGVAGGICGTVDCTLGGYIENCWFAGSMESAQQQFGITGVYTPDGSTSESDGFWHIRYCYTAPDVYKNASAVHLVERFSSYTSVLTLTRLQGDTDGCGLGLFQREGPNNNHSLIVHTTTQNGYQKFWKDSVNTQAADSMHVTSGQTGLIDALNSWCGQKSQTMKDSYGYDAIFSTSAMNYSFWTVGHDGLPAPISTDVVWSGAQEAITAVNDIYSVYTAGQLAYLAAQVDSYYGKTIRLMNDIDLSGKRWDKQFNNKANTSGTSASFNGLFDGQGYAIRGLYACEINSEDYYHGLFGITGSSAIIQNLHVQGVVRGNTDEIGGIVGRNRGMIDRCSFQGRVYGQRHVGGISGYNYGTIRNCRSDGQVLVMGRTDGSLYGGNMVGGIAGTNSGSILNCFSMGQAARSESALQYSYSGTPESLGGIVGSNTGTVDNCFSGAKDSCCVAGATQSGGGQGTVTSSYYLNGGVIYSADGTLLTAIEGKNLVETLCDILNEKAKPADATQQSNTPSARNVSESVLGVQYSNSEVLRAEMSALRSAETEAVYEDWTQSICANESMPYFEGFAGGDGGTESPYVIATIEQLAYLATSVNSGEVTYNGKAFLLSADLVFNPGSFGVDGTWLDVNGKPMQAEGSQTMPMPEQWSAIGSEANPFTGIFDGQGHTIAGLCSDSASGLFGVIGDNALIKNVFIHQSWFGGGACAVAGSAMANAQIINCGSTAYGSGGDLSIPGVCINCYDRNTNLSAAALNVYPGIGSDYCRWYEALEGYPVFMGTYVTISYMLGDGSFSSAAPESYLYGEAPAAVPTPVANGKVFSAWTTVIDTAAGATEVEWVKSLSELNLSGVSHISLFAVWAVPLTADESFWSAYCTFDNNGVYVLGSDVVLAEPLIVTDRRLLDLNGHTVSGYEETGLIQICGGTLILMNGGEGPSLPGQISSNAAAIKGFSGALLCVNGIAGTDTPKLSIPFCSRAALGEEISVYQSSLFPINTNDDFKAFFASYDENGKMERVIELDKDSLTIDTTSETAQHTIAYLQTLSLEQLKTQLTKLIMVPSSWLEQ